MTVKDLTQALGLTVLSQGDPTAAVTGCYCGDLLSWVMSRAQAGDAWLTVMGNINSMGEAALTDAACIILTDNAPLDADALQRARENEICVLQTSDGAYQTAIRIHEFLQS